MSFFCSWLGEEVVKWSVGSPLPDMSLTRAISDQETAFGNWLAPPVLALILRDPSGPRHLLDVRGRKIIHEEEPIEPWQVAVLSRTPRKMGRWFCAGLGFVSQ